MNDGLIPRRYAKALYMYADEYGDAQEIYELIKSQGFRHLPLDRIKRAVLNPSLSDEDKSLLMLKKLQNMGGKPGGSLDKFIRLCVRNNRAEYMHKISLAYLEVYREAKGIAHVVITTATEMSDEEIQPVLDFVNDFVNRRLDGKTPEIERECDPDLIGGFTINIDGMVLDTSVKKKLNDLRVQLQKK